MDKVIFDPEKHAYYCRGIRYPSVTQIIAAAGLYGDTSRWTDYSRDRGTYVHQIIEYHLAGELDEATIDPALLPYFAAWLRFEAEAGFVSEGCEKRLVSERHRFAGTIDHIGHLNGHYVIIDVKSGAPVPATGVQLAGYEILLGVPGPRRYGLHLKDDGKYSLVEYRGREDRAVFIAALNLYYWKANNGIERRAA